PVLDHVQAADAISTTDLVEFQNHRQRADYSTVQRNGNTMLESDRDYFGLIGRLLRREGHAEIGNVDAFDFGILKHARLIADVQTIFVGTVGLCDRRFDGNSFLLAESDHFAPAGKLGSIFFDSPRRNDFYAGFQSLGGKLKAALVIAFSRRT